MLIYEMLLFPFYVSRNKLFMYYMLDCYLPSFKVYIVRVNDTYEEGALSLEKLHAGLRQMNPSKLSHNTFLTCSLIKL